ncbi:MAG: hypothetical protein ACYTX0_47885, partial [Nostoc sp.]
NGCLSGFSDTLTLILLLFKCTELFQKSNISPIHDDYRLRFGIESSYRMKNQCRIKTTIKNPTIRLLFVALAFLIINVWIYLVWHYISRFKRSTRQVFSDLFTLKQMLEFLRQVIDRNYGVACEIYLPSG